MVTENKFEKFKTVAISFFLDHGKGAKEGINITNFSWSISEEKGDRWNPA